MVCGHHHEEILVPVQEMGDGSWESLGIATSFSFQGGVSGARLTGQLLQVLG